MGFLAYVTGDNLGTKSRFGILMVEESAYRTGENPWDLVDTVGLK